MYTLQPDSIWTAEGLRHKWCVTIDAGRIVGLTPPERQPHVDRVLPGRLLLPGLVDVHSHAFQRAFRGHVQWRAADRDDFWSWRVAMYGVANRLDPDGIEAVSKLAFLELARAGGTRIGEFHYLHHAPDGARYADPDELARRVIAAALDVGVRIALLRVVYGRHSPGRPLEPDQRRFGDRSVDEALAAVQRLGAIADPRVTVGIAPHSVRAVPGPWLAELASYGGIVHAHVAEQPGEVAACLAEHGKSPLAVFADAGLVTDRFSAVHLTHPGPGDLDRLRSAGAAIAVCPATELDLGDGFLPVDARDGIRIGVGSDSHAITDPFGEARAVEMHARALAGKRNVMAIAGDRASLAERILRIASTDGDRMLGGRGEGLAIGAHADMIAVDLRSPEAAGVPPLEAVAFVAQPGWITDSWVGGNAVIVDGHHPREDAIVAAARPYLGV